MHTPDVVATCSSISSTFSLAGPHFGSDPSGLGSDWKIAENAYKLHACCGHAHSAIDLAIARIRAVYRGWNRDPLGTDTATATGSA